MSCSSRPWTPRRIRLRRRLPRVKSDRPLAIVDVGGRLADERGVVRRIRGCSARNRRVRVLGRLVAELLQKGRRHLEGRRPHTFFLGGNRG